MDIRLEARDASGVVTTDHVEVLVATKTTLAAMLAVGAAGIAVAAWGFAEPGVWPTVAAVLGALFALIALGSLALALAGRCIGMPWQFTP